MLLSSSREFLEEKLSDDPVIDFQVLGPSPCHVEVFIDTATSAAAVEAKDLSIVGAGYRTLSSASMPTHEGPS